MKALITGAHGFLGRHFAQCLGNSGFAVHGFGHGAWDPGEASRFGISYWHPIEVTVEALATYGGEPNIIVHCAGSASVGFSVLHPFEDYVRTVSSTVAVLEYIRLHSRSTVMVYPSSTAVYGTVDSLPIQESTSPRPASPYGVHKLMAEDACRSYASGYGISVALIRFFSIYGEGLRKQLLWDACTKAENDEAMFFGTGGELRDWLHVEDAALLVREAIGRASASVPVVNGGSGIGLPVRDIVGAVFREYGSSVEPTFSGIARPGDPPGYQADVTQAHSWGWSPRIDWRQGVRRYVQWFRSERR